MGAREQVRAGWGWWLVCAAAVLGVLGQARAQESGWAAAEARRNAFERQQTHSRLGYTRVLDGFRAVYHGDPADPHAADAVNAVAELLAEEGREFQDSSLLQAAAKQYEFLRSQYPGSPLREPALLSEARIAARDLHNDDAARERYRSLLREAPHSASGRAARVELVALDRSAAPARGDGPAIQGPRDSLPAEAPAAAAEVSTTAAGSRAALSGAAAGPAFAPAPVSRARPVAASAGAPAVVTGIRHWSTPTYTRVAIDLGGEVRFEAARVPNPDRLYFDLHGARLAPELVGRSFDVTDNGFLRRVRAAQEGPDVARVVLDVSDVTEYSAFLLPNPYRLIIDIHGKKASAPASPAVARAPSGPGARPAEQEQPVARAAAGRATAPDDLQELPVSPAAGSRASAAANASGLPAMAPTALTPTAIAPAAMAPTTSSPGARAAAVREGEAAAAELAARTGVSDPPEGRISTAPPPRTGATTRPTPARPVPNAVAVRSPENGEEVAAVSAEPGRVEATRQPTASPIAAVVRPAAGRTRLQPGARAKASDAALDEPPSSAPSTAPSTAPSAASGTSSGASSRSAPGTLSSPSAGAQYATPDPLLAARRGRRGAATPDAAPAKAADRTADGQTSLVRALGLRIGRIVIDAGHGGHDSGTLGVDGIEEKDVVLDVALRLGKLLHDRLGAEIIYTRSDDTFIPLETRTAIANKAQADLFLSIHANSSPDPLARGVEVYYLNFTSDPTALDVASRENAAGGQSVHQLSDLVKKIALKDKIAESREFAADVDGALFAGLAKGNDGLRNRGVKKAPFVVLIGANMPSILAEISFVTNARDAAELREPEYRERVAESLFAGVAKYEAGLAGGRLPAVQRASAAAGPARAGKAPSTKAD